jgi:uncharacterized membrane protein
MVSESFCKDCIQKHDCRSVYKQLGKSSGESIVLKVILAFLLPMIVFIVSLSVSVRLLTGVIGVEKLQMVFSLLPALLATFICIFIIKIINKRLIFKPVIKH